MDEIGIEPEEARNRLVQLVDALKDPIVEDTIFEGGRRLPTAVTETDPPRLRLNRELLGRVGDDEILAAMARPVAQMTNLASVAVSLVFQSHDEQVLRDLATRASRRADAAAVRPAEVPAWVTYRIETLVDRLRRMCAHLGRASVFTAEGADSLRSAVLGSKTWPEWTDVSDIPWCQKVVAAVREALEDTPHAPYAEAVTELLWDSLALGPQSFLRHAGRTLRGSGGNLDDVGSLLGALAAAVTIEGETEVSLSLQDWQAYADVWDAWENLNRHEKAMFGPVLLRDRSPAVSVLQPARFAFGLDEPKELPWDAPVLCWTVREQNALRDLLVGFIKTLPGHTEDALEGHAELYSESEPPLVSAAEQKAIGIQVVALHADTPLTPPASFTRAWSSCLHRILDQYLALEPTRQQAMNRALRHSYDELFPDSKPIWARRFYDLDQRKHVDAFKRLVTAPNELYRTPVLLDPFHAPNSPEPAPYPTLMFPVGVSGSGKIPFFVPVVALCSTLNGAPLRVRVVEVPAGAGGNCEWLCDRGLHLAKLSKQAVELILRAVRGDALQMAVFEN